MNNKKLELSKIFSWTITGIVLIISLLMVWLLRTPQQITAMLEKISSDLKIYAVVAHIIFIIMFISGIIFKKARNIIFPVLMLLVSVSATVVAVFYFIPPNIIIYGLYSILIIFAFINRKFDFDIDKLSFLSQTAGFIVIIMGLWYLHWVEKPIMLNALIFSPLGIANCPTMLVICGILILNTNSKSYLLEAVAGLSTLFIGFMGIFRLQAYVDVFLIVAALFILIRIGSYLSFNQFFLKGTGNER